MLLNSGRRKFIWNRLKFTAYKRKELTGGGDRVNLKNTRGIVSIVLVLTMLAGLMVGCGGKTSQPTIEQEKKLTKIRLTEVVHSVFYAPMYVAMNKGFFKEEGLEIELSTGWGGDKAMTALVAGQAEIALIGPETIIYVHQQGLSKPIKAFAQLTQRDGSFLVGRSGQSFSWENLKGKTIIGARKGGVPEMVLEWTLKQKGLKPFVDVNILQNIQFTATAGAFQAGTGDYVALFEPTASTLELQGAGQVVASFGAENNKIPYTVFMCSDDYLSKNRETVEAFTRAIYKAQQWVGQQDPSVITAAIQPSFVGDDNAALKKAVERYYRQDTWPKDPRIQHGGLDYLQDIMDSAGELNKRVPENIMVDKSVAEKVIK